MRVFLDTNVLASAFATRGLCSDVLHVVLSEHILVTGECNIGELQRVLSAKFKVPASIVRDIETFLREHEVVPVPSTSSPVAIRDPDDEVVLASAISANADILVTGDSDLLEVADRAPVKIVDPRGFWSMMRGRSAK